MVFYGSGLLIRCTGNIRFGEFLKKRLFIVFKDKATIKLYEKEKKFVSKMMMMERNDE